MTGDFHVPISHSKIYFPLTCVHVHEMPIKTRGGIRSLGAGIRGSSERPDVDGKD